MTKKVKEVPTISFEDFIVAPKFENPQKFILKLQGKETDHFLMVIGKDAKPVRRAKSKSMFEAAKKFKTNEWSDDEADKLTNTILASAIVSWSFDMPCNDENKIKLLNGNPSVAEELDSFLGDDTNFLGK